MGTMVKFRIIETLAELSRSGLWHKLLTITAWGDGAPKLDLRSWQQTGDILTPGRGVTLSVEEARVLMGALRVCLEQYEMDEAPAM